MTTIDPKDYETRCGECENFHNGCCDSASELLVQEGFPFAVVRPSPNADATNCPDFQMNLAGRIDRENALHDDKLDIEWLRSQGNML